jgi:hypothetical protein
MREEEASQLPVLSPPAPTCPCNSSRCVGKQQPLNLFHLKKDGQLSKMCNSCTDKDNSHKRKAREDVKLKEEQERWEFKSADQFFIEVADATERDVEYNVIVDMSDIISFECPQEEQAKAIGTAVSEASALHWT